MGEARQYAQRAVPSIGVRFTHYLSIIGEGTGRPSLKIAMGFNRLFGIGDLLNT